MASSKLRTSCSMPNLLLSCLNFLLLLLAASSVVPIILLKSPPTSLGWALIISSSVALIAAFLGFYSQLTHFCFGTHVSFILASLATQVLGFLALFAREKTSLSMLGSTRDPREAMVLVRLECGILMAMMILQVAALALTCAIHRCWVREYEGLGEEREKMAARKRSRRIEAIREESMANVVKINEGKAMELDEKMKSKYGSGQWVKKDIEG